MCSVDKDFQLQFWERLLQQAKISLNFLIKSRTLLHPSAYTHIFGSFDSDQTPLAPPGKRIIIHNRPNDCASWAPHGEYAWYIGPEMEHCIFHKAYIPNTIEERISDTVEFSQKQFSMPHMSSTYATFHAAQDFIYALHNPAPASPLATL